jgi:hypothetical protein
MYGEPMLLAAVETYLSRPIAPTRRVAIGDLELPCEPAPGFGGILIGGIVARFAPDIDPDLHDELLVLMTQVERGQRIAQPRLRHRLQADRIGLQHCTHRLVGVGEELRFEFQHERGTAAQHVLCAVYAAGTVPWAVRTTVMDAARKGLRWRGGSDAALVAHLSGRSGSIGVAAIGDPVSWALQKLALRPAAAVPSRREVQRAFRDQLRSAHPDHGASDSGAAQRIADLSEARRILLG